MLIHFLYDHNFFVIKMVFRHIKKHIIVEPIYSTLSLELKKNNQYEYTNITSRFNVPTTIKKCCDNILSRLLPQK